MFFGSKMYDTPERFFQQKKKHAKVQAWGPLGPELYWSKAKNWYSFEYLSKFYFSPFSIFCIAVLKLMLNCKKGFISMNNKFFFF